MGKLFIGDDEVASVLSRGQGVDIVDNLESTRTDAALSANQGRVLNNKKQDQLRQGEGITLDTDNNISLSKASKNTIGGVKVDGDSIDINDEGTISISCLDSKLEQGEGIDLSFDIETQTTTISAPKMVGADETTDGKLGTVPAPTSFERNNFLKGDGTWSEVEQKNAYDSINFLTNYLYETYYSRLDYDYADNYFKNNADDLILGLCSTVRKNEFFAKNNDWLYSEIAEFVVKTEPMGGRHATLGVASAIPGLTNDIVKSKKYNKLYNIVPFCITDGINDCGLSVSVNVVPKEKGDNNNIYALVSEEYKINVRVLSRFILDRFNSVDEMKDYLPKYVSIYAKEDRDYDLHFMVADKNKTCVIEFIDNQMIISEEHKPYMTNFHLTDVRFNTDGSVYTPETQTTEKKPTTTNKITPHGQGLERYNLINEKYDTIHDFETINNFMQTLQYTRAYETSSQVSNPYWFTELVGGPITVDSKPNDFNERKTEAGRKYLHRTRQEGTENYGTWQTSHASVYNIEDLMLSIIPQESGHHFLFRIDTIPAQDVPVDNVTIRKNTNKELYAVKSTTDNFGIVKVDNDTITIQDGIISAHGGSTTEIDNETIKRNEDGKIYAVTATADNIGMVKVDNDSITIENGVISSHGTSTTPIDDITIKKNEEGKIYTVTATSDTAGIVKVDNETITIEDGTITAHGTSPTPIDGETIKKNEDGKIYAVQATQDRFGIVKPDGVTTKINEDGTLTATSSESKIKEVINGNGLNLSSEGNLYMSVATSQTSGAVMPDNDTITIENGVISSHGTSTTPIDDVTIKKNDEGKIYATTATPTTAGIVAVDNDTITIENGIIKSHGTSTTPIDEVTIRKNTDGKIYAVQSTAYNAGIVKVDNETIKIDNGTIYAVQADKTNTNVTPAISNINVGDGLSTKTLDGYAKDFPHNIFYKYIRGIGATYVQTDIADIDNIAFEITLLKDIPSNQHRNAEGYNNILGAISSTNPQDRLTLEYDEAEHKYKIFYGTDVERDTGYFECECLPTQEMHIKFNALGCVFTNITTGEVKSFRNSVNKHIALDKPLQIFGINNASTGGSFDGWVGRIILTVNGQVIYDCLPAKTGTFYGLYNLITHQYLDRASFAGAYEETYMADVNASTLTLQPMVGATSERKGIIGGVPAPTVDDTNKFLKGDGTWSDVSATLNIKSGQGIDIVDVGEEHWINTKIDSRTLKINDNNEIEVINKPNTIEPGTAIEITSTSTSTVVSAKIGTNSELGVVKADGVSVFLDPDGTLSSKTTLPDIAAGDGIDIVHGTSHNLPDEYVELQFVRGRANCYLDTGINADSKTAYQVVAQRLANPSDTFNVFGAVKTGAVVGVQFQHDNNARCFMGSYSADYTPTATSVFYDPITFYGSTQQRKITNNTTREVFQNENVYGTDFDVGKNYYIGKINGLTSGADFTGRLFEILIWQNDILVRDYIPAKKRETQEIGFYDIVNHTFNTSSTASQFIEGPDVVPTTIIEAKTFVGATASTQGIIGAVPAPNAGETTKYLRSDGTWQELSNSYKTTIPTSIYINNSIGADWMDSGRGLSETLPFKTVQGALDIMSKMYKIGSGDCEMVIQEYPNKVVEPIIVPYIESDGGSLLFNNSIIFRTTTNQPCVMVKNATKITFDDVYFEANSTATALNLVELRDANVAFNRGAFVNYTNNTMVGLKAVKSEITLLGTTFSNNADGGFSAMCDLVNTVLSQSSSGIGFSRITSGVGFKLKRSTMYYDGFALDYPSTAVDWIPFDLITSNLYIEHLPLTQFLYSEEHQGTKDKLSNLYDVNGLVQL